MHRSRPSLQRHLSLLQQGSPLTHIIRNNYPSKSPPRVTTNATNTMDSNTNVAPPHCCYIIPPRMLKAIADSQAASKDSRFIANKTLNHIAKTHSARIEAIARTAEGQPHPRPQGIVPSHVFQAILDSESASEHAKDQAKNHLASMGALKAAKTSHGGGKPASSAMHLFRLLYDSQQTNREPGTQLFVEGDLPANPDAYAKQVYDNFGSTFKFYSEVLSRNSIDNNGMNLIGSVHFDEDNSETEGYDNAFWDGTEMCFGDGDPQIFNTFTESLDITGHELTHGVTENTANLWYEYQSGALNESISDVFGSMVKQYAYKQKAKDADWLIGEGLFRDPEGARALRDMANPGTAYNNNKYIGSDPQPKDMDGYVDLPNTDEGDFGGVHTNSGIPNRAFYLAATGVGEYSWEPAGKIWYAALTDPSLKLPKNTTNRTFKIFADLTIKHAQEIGGSAAVDAVNKAWKTVKVL
jgi:Zn-dependent metalloprotease